jgi:Cd2+/Zn2+-exporting ATPase
MSSTGKSIRMRIGGMDCADCALTIEKALRDLDGVASVDVSFATEMLEATGDIEHDALARRIRELGYDVLEERPAAPITPAAQGLTGFLRFVWRQPHGRPAVLLAAALTAVAVLNLAGVDTLAVPRYLLELATIAALGLPIALKGLRALVFARRVAIDLLIALATIGAVAIGAAGEAATVVVLFTLGEALEAYSAERSRASLRSLVNLRPARAVLLARAGEAAHAHPAAVDVASLRPGDRVLARAGERIPADGRVVEGRSTIDEAALTGESVPVVRAAGDEVFAGTINGEGTLAIEVTRGADDFTIAQIARLVEQAQSRQSAAERYVDRFAAWYTPAVVLVAIAVAAVPPLAFGAPFLGTSALDPGWAYRGLALLIVACPCALVISIPVTVVSALTRLANLGVLVKGGALLQELAQVRVFAFDKTGTLTRGAPVVTGTRANGCAHGDETAEDCEPCDDLLAVAAAVEGGSEHPYARAVVAAARERALGTRYPLAEGITSHAGRGISGTIAGQRVTVGNTALVEPAASDPPDAAHDGARSVMLVSQDGRLKGHIFVEDEPRESTREALAALGDIDAGYRFVMLTGDRRGVAARIAGRLGRFDEIRAELLPDGKLEAIAELERDYGKTAMVGDGINDAPALAAARLGIAMGGAGSHQAMEVADIVLMADDLARLPIAVAISRKTQRVIKENIVLSLGLKLVFLGLAIPGLATLWMAVLADVGATVLVTLNGMRMLRAP